MKQQPEENPIRDGVINRYYRKDDIQYETRYDEDGDYEVATDVDVRYFDRVTGECVLSYDGADPANRPPLGPSDEECFYKKGLDINEEIPISRCKNQPTADEIGQHAWRQARKVEKEQEIERGEELLGELDLFSYLEIDAGALSFNSDPSKGETYRDDEEKLILPAFERKGFSRVAFFMGEQDSFGPLSRGIRAWKDDKSYVFYYG
jgi:hypothetical protein